MNALLRIAVLLWVSSSVSSATAFVARVPAISSNVILRQYGWPGRTNLRTVVGLDSRISVWKIPRGGQQEAVTEDAAAVETGDDAEAEDEADWTTETEHISHDPVKQFAGAASAPVVSKIAAVFTTIGKTYSMSLEASPILTKSCTAGFIFGLSDYLAQTIERSGDKDAVKSKFNWSRLLSTTLVGLLYFGPAAHFWYEWIFRLLPGTGLASTLYKAFWGQVLFGPSFTCIFFATNLLQSGDFSLKAWWQKIRSDLPGAWLAGVGYWPIVDLISYSVIPVKLIPLFVNMASLIWTVYLSMVANKGKVK